MVFQNRLKGVIHGGNRKAIVLLIIINVVVIGIYLMPTGYILSADNVLSSFSTAGNQDQAGTKAYLKVDDKGVRYHDLPSREQMYGSLSDSRNKGRSLKRKLRIQGTFSGNVNTRNSENSKVVLDDEGGDGDVNNSSFVYSPAFPKRRKPIELSSWVRAPDSHVYFQPVDHQEAWVFSAFYQDPWQGSKGDGSEAAKPMVRVLFMVRREPKRKVFCRYYTESRKTLGTVKGRKLSMRDGHGTTYAASFVQCPLPKDTQAQPLFVSLTFDRNVAKPTNQIEIQYQQPRTRQFTVCFSPLHTNYNYTSQLIEAFEFNLLLGAEHLFVYNFSISADTDAILRRYEADGLVTISQWRLPNLELWYYGQVLAVNDCIYRNRGASKYVVVIDTDELIVPHQHSNWADLVQDLARNPSMLNDVKDDVVERYPLTEAENSGSEFGAWSFRCSFYVDKRLDIEELKGLKRFKFSLKQKQFLARFPSSRILSLKRLDSVFIHGKRSKMVVRPECVDIGGVHIVTQLKPGYKVGYVKKDVAMLHHYRQFNDYKSNTLDLSALRFKDAYLERLVKAVSRFPSMFPSWILAE